MSPLVEESKVTLDQMISKGHKIILENLYMPESYTARHVLICVSGFLSETGEMESSWRYLMDECRERSVPLYTVRWESKDTSQLQNIAVTEAKKNLGSVLSNTKKFSDLFSKQNLTSVGKFIGSTVSNGADTFKEAR